MRAAPLSSFAALVPLAPLAMGAMGCTGSVGTAGSDPTHDADSAVTQALVLVERTSDPTEGVRATASARFARVASGVSPADTLRAIGASLDLPARGGCTGIRAVDSTATAAEPIPVVELLDMGRVSVEAEGTVTTLIPRQLPYVTDVVTGTVYARAAEAIVLPAAAPYAIHVAGSGDIAGFDVVASAPRDPSDVTIVQETTPGKVVPSGATLDFSWPASPARTVAGDAIYVEVQPAGARCTLSDGVGDGTAGHATIPSSLLGEAGSLVVHRVHTEPLAVVVRGIDAGELRFDFARVVSFEQQQQQQPRP